jgi:acyl-CoA synthetase (NDP forming)
MARVNTTAIEAILREAHDQGRSGLYEHECYRLLAATGAEASPVHRLLPVNKLPTESDLENFSGEKVVLKVVSPDIIHKTEAGGVRIVTRTLEAVQEAFSAMVREIPATYAAYLKGHQGAEQSEAEVRERMVGILLCQFVPQDKTGFATEFFLGLRHTEEFGPILTAGLGGVEMEILASQTVKGAAVTISPAATISPKGFFQLFEQTLSYQRLSGGMRGSGLLVEDDILLDCFESFLDLANHFSPGNPEAPFWLEELEVNPFVIAGGRLAPLDGVCRFRQAGDALAKRPIHKIKNLLRPESVGVIGASANKPNMGRIILQNILGAGFRKDMVRVIHPKAEVIEGISCVASLGQLDLKLDMIVVAVGADQVPPVLEELLEHDSANAVILIPGGLGEKEGKQDTERLLRKKIRASHKTESGGPVFLGGNSLGVISHPGRYDTMFIPDCKLPKSRGDHPRKVCFLSQSGAFIISNLSRMPWLDPAYAVSMGNQIDLTAGDLLTFLKDDPDLEVFALYMEGFQTLDGLAFTQAVRETVALGKDVVFYKAGRTSEGRSATAGHTASVAGDYAVCEAALTQAGALVAGDFNEFSDLLRLAVFLRGKSATGNRLGAVSNAGYEAVGMADSLHQRGANLHLAHFTQKSTEELQETLLKGRLDGLVDVRNPLDVTPMATDAVFTQLMQQILEDDQVDVGLAGVIPLTPAMQTLPASEGHRENLEDSSSIAQRLPELARSTAKPLVAVVDCGTLFDPLAETLQAGGMPVFRSADRAVRALARWVAAKRSNNI